ncbi:hypothetical protein [Xanthomonas arboricola]|uniref:hypothetical protein n=1 Tax=Xanthomonas arboricola TaxID=56448 RepID=UPI0015E0D26E|nr:hypothetical protein [Xanthomonas arboricola]
MIEAVFAQLVELPCGSVVLMHQHSRLPPIPKTPPKKTPPTTAHAAIGGVLVAWRWSAL